MHRAKALLAVSVIIVRSRIPRLHAGIDERLVERVSRHVVATGHAERPFAAAIVVFATLPGFGPLEIWQAVGIAPAVRARRDPFVEIAGMAADIDHAIDRRSAAKALAARAGNLPVIDAGLRLG